ncbi:MAG: GAF domain-containing protein, partial [Acidobacteriota bacterium]|nr:GAF domain-containing protein [Acidobacteriota bacterium]
IQACVFHHLWEDGRSEVMAAHSQPGVGAEMLSQLAARLLKEVWATRRPLVKNGLADFLHDDLLVSTGVINNYLGVPLFDSRGEVFGVASLFSDDSGPFDENDLWWMEMAA